MWRRIHRLACSSCKGLGRLLTLQRTASLAVQVQVQLLEAPPSALRLPHLHSNCVYPKMLYTPTPTPPHPQVHPPPPPPPPPRTPTSSICSLYSASASCLATALSAALPGHLPFAMPTSFTFVILRDICNGGGGEEGKGCGRGLGSALCNADLLHLNCLVQHPEGGGRAQALGSCARSAPHPCYAVRALGPTHGGSARLGSPVSLVFLQPAAWMALTAYLSHHSGVVRSGQSP